MSLLCRRCTLAFIVIANITIQTWWLILFLLWLELVVIWLSELIVIWRSELVVIGLSLELLKIIRLRWDLFVVGRLCLELLVIKRLWFILISIYILYRFGSLLRLRRNNGLKRVIICLVLVISNLRFIIIYSYSRLLNYCKSILLSSAIHISVNDMFSLILRISIVIIFHLIIIFDVFKTII